MQKLTNKTVIRTTSYSQREIISNIMKLYVPDGFDLDPTYSKGIFYKGLKQPKFKFDIVPRKGCVIPVDVEYLPLKNESVNSVMFDPPFLATTGNVAKSKDKSNIMIKRFGYYKNMPDLWNMYYGAIKELHRVLNVGGICVIKMQDSVSSGKQYMSHLETMNCAINAGFYCRDVFILLSKNVILSGKHNNQQHARKFHSYFIVFEKKNVNIKYRFIDKEINS